MFPEIQIAMYSHNKVGMFCCLFSFVLLYTMAFAYHCYKIMVRHWYIVEERMD